MNSSFFHIFTNYKKENLNKRKVSVAFASGKEQESAERTKSGTNQYDLIGCFTFGFKRAVELPMLVLFVFVFYIIVTFYDYLIILQSPQIATSTQVISPWGLPELGIYFLVMLVAPYIYIFTNPAITVSDALITILWIGYLLTVVRSFFEAGYLGNMHSKLFQSAEESFIDSIMKFALRILAFAIIYFTIIYAILSAIMVTQNSFGISIPNYTMVFSALYATVTYLLMLTPYVIVAEDEKLLVAIKKSIRYMLSLVGLVYFIVLGILTSIAASIATVLLSIPWIGYIVSLAILAFFTVALTLSTFCYYKYLKLPKLKSE